MVFVVLVLGADGFGGVVLADEEAVLDVSATDGVLRRFPNAVSPPELDLSTLDDALSADMPTTSPTVSTVPIINIPFSFKNLVIFL